MLGCHQKGDTNGERVHRPGRLECGKGTIHLMAMRRCLKLTIRVTVIDENVLYVQKSATELHPCWGTSLTI